MKNTNKMLLLLLVIISFPFLLYLYALCNMWISLHIANNRCQHLCYEEILPGNKYLFKDGKKYGLSLEFTLGEKRIETDSSNTSNCYLSRLLIINIKKGNELILTNIYKIWNGTYGAQKIVIDYPTIIKPILDGYTISGSNNFLYIHQRCVFGQQFRFDYSNKHKVAVSGDNGNTWVAKRE